VFASAPTGWLAEWLGWGGFFLMCALIAIPGLLLLRWITRLVQTEAGEIKT
jgi:PAT family beta-lactamase induction signal transducer AmpG